MEWASWMVVLLVVVGGNGDEWFQPFLPHMLRSALTLSKGKSTCFKELIGVSGDVGKVVGKCGRGLEQCGAGIRTRFQWMILMLDSWGRPSPGLTEQGQFLWFGDYNQCRKVLMPSGAAAKYCLVRSASMVERMGEEGTEYPLIFKLGLCLPPSCSATEISTFLNASRAFIPRLLPPEYRPSFERLTIKAYCKEEEEEVDLEKAPGSIAFIVASALLGLLAVVGTAVHCLKKHHLLFFRRDEEEEETRSLVTHPSDYAESLWSYKSFRSIKKKAQAPKWWLRVFLGFSVGLNLKSILDTTNKKPSSKIKSLFGIRVLSMLWVIVGHSYLFALPHVGNLAGSIEGFRERFWAQIIFNASLSVDSFFLLSGILTAYIWFNRRGRGKTGPRTWLLFYAHRLLRLTPTYAYVVAFVMFVYEYIGSGPLWKRGEIFGVDCDESDWWRQLLYVSNFFPRLCLPWMWYLAVEVQFQAVSPLFLWLLSRRWRWGVGFLCLLIVASGIGRGWVVSTQNLPPNLLLLLPEQSFDSNMQKLFTQVYAMPHMRIGPYLIGILLGWSLSQRNRKINLMDEPMLKVVLAWIASLVLLGWGCFGSYPLFLGFHNHYYNFLLAGFARTAWALGLAFLVWLCHTGRGWRVNSVLSWSGWVPFANLTYAAYLTHELLLVGLFHSITKPIIINSHLHLLVTTLGYAAASYVLALLLNTFVESPPLSIEKLLFRRSAKKNKTVSSSKPWNERTSAWVLNSGDKARMGMPRKSVSFSCESTLYHPDQTSPLRKTRSDSFLSPCPILKSHSF